jgi:hypothetical protein
MAVVQMLDEVLAEIQALQAETTVCGKVPPRVLD